MCIATETEITNTLITEINEKLAMVLPPVEVIERQISKESGPIPLHLIMIGGRQSKLVFNAATRAGYACTYVEVPSLRAEDVASTSAALKAVVDTAATLVADTVTVFQVFDKNIYMAKTLDSGIIPAAKGVAVIVTL